MNGEKHRVALHTEGLVCICCPDITSSTQFPVCHAAEMGHSKVSSHSVSADGIVSRHNFHCMWSRRGWKSLLLHTPSAFVLDDPHQQSVLGSRSSRFPVLVCRTHPRIVPPCLSLSVSPSPPLPPLHGFWEVKPGFPRFHSLYLLNQ